MQSVRKFHHSKLDSLNEKEKISFVSKSLYMWFKSHNSYYKRVGLTSEDKLTQHFVKLEDFYDRIQPILPFGILSFPKFKTEIFLSEKAKKLMGDRIFMADFNHYLDQVLSSTFDALVLEKERGISLAKSCVQKPIISIIEEARAKAIAMADSDELWS